MGYNMREFIESVKIRGALTVCHVESERVKRLVVVRQRSQRWPDLLPVYLCSNEYHMAGEADILLTPDKTRVGYNIIVETDVLGVVRRSDCDKLLGLILPQDMDHLHEMGRVVASGQEETDDDWLRWKLSEVVDMQKLSAPVMERLLR